MKKSADISTLFKPLGRVLQRFHITLFIVVIVAGLTYAVLSLDTVINSSAIDTAATGGATTNSTTPDAATITKLQSLHTSSSAPAVTLPAGRINPFAE